MSAQQLDAIAAQLQGYDPQALRADLVTAFLRRMVQPIAETETLPLMQALGRVVAHDVVSPLNVPPHDNSAMDGYAFNGAALASQPLRLQVVGTALAGAAWRGNVGPGQALRIMTGAVMPAGLDTVAPQELVQLDGDTVSIPAGQLRPGDNRRCAGEDLALGQVAVATGERLNPATLGLIASLGMGQVNVLRRLRVAFFSTGDEILSVGQAPREGAVYDSNRYTLFGLLTRLGCEPIDMGVIADNPAALEAAFVQAASVADAVITSGGVSVGEADHTKATMRKLGAQAGGVAFWRIAMRPGRPMAVGTVQRPHFNAKSALNPYEVTKDSYSNNSIPVFGLPGNPVAVMVTFLAFVRPTLLAMMGCQEAEAPLLQAASEVALRKKPGRTEYQRGIVSRNANGQLQVRTTGNQGSGVLSSMAQANGLIVLHHDQGNVAVGDMVEVMMLQGLMS